MNDSFEPEPEYPLEHSLPSLTFPNHLDQAGWDVVDGILMARLKDGKIQALRDTFTRGDDEQARWNSIKTWEWLKVCRWLMAEAIACFQIDQEIAGLNYMYPRREDWERREQHKQ